jgi:hypothetical protein
MLLLQLQLTALLHVAPPAQVPVAVTVRPFASVKQPSLVFRSAVLLADEDLADFFPVEADAPAAEDCFRPLKKTEKMSQACEFEVRKKEMAERTARVEAEAELKLAALVEKQKTEEERAADRAASAEAARAAREAAVAARAEGRPAGRGFEMPSLSAPSMPSLSSPIGLPGGAPRDDFGDKAACFWCG